MSRPSRSRSGYTLLEVLVAFAVLTLSLSTLLPTMSATGTRAGRVDAEWAATEFARSKLEEAGVVAPLAAGEERGTYRQLWSWRIVTRSYRAEGLPIGLNLFEIEVEVEDPGGRTLARLVTVRQAMGESGP